MASDKPDIVLHRLMRARDWQGRPEFDLLCQWWRDGGLGVCALVGMGGAGKTAIADRFLQTLPGGYQPMQDVSKDESLPAPGVIRVFSFYDEPNADSFFAQLAQWLQEDFGVEWSKGEDGVARASLQRMVESLARPRHDQHLFIVLDGLEKIQDDGLRGGCFGQIIDGRLRQFVVMAADGGMPGLSLLITSRALLYDAWAHRAGLNYHIDVQKLSLESCVRLLRQRGVKKGTNGQLEAIAENEGCHALSVDLMGGYIAKFCEGDPGQVPPEPEDHPAEKADATFDPDVTAIRVQERKFARLAERYHEALSKSDPAALALLQRVCLFRLPVKAETLTAIFTGKGKEEIAGPELADLDQKELDKKLNLLTKMKLLEKSDAEEVSKEVSLRRRSPEASPDVSLRGGTTKQPLQLRPPSSFSTHPAVRDGFLQSLDQDAQKQGHNAAREGLNAALGDSPGDNPSDPATLDLLEEIVYHTLEAGHAQEAWGIYENRMGQYENLGWRLGAYERGERICRAFAQGQPPRNAPLPEGLSEDAQAAFINEWALYLKDLGQLDDAARCYERQIEMRMRQEKWKNASIGNQNLAEVLLLAGRLTEGLRAAEEALELADHADGADARYRSHAFRGQARGLTGEPDDALDDFRDALHWQHEHEGRTDGPLYSIYGLFHTLLLVHTGRNEEATRLTLQNSKILVDGWGPRHQDVPKCNLLFADLARERGELDAARGLLDEAHEWAVARNAKEPLCWAALVRARIALDEYVRRVSSPGFSLQGGSPATTQPAEAGTTNTVLAECRVALEKGLRIARDCGFGIYHIDLLLLQARVALHEGNTEAAEHDIRIALAEGVQPSEESGLPTLLAATDPECGYAWGEAEALHRLAETRLLRAAQMLGESTYAPAHFEQLDEGVKENINAARDELGKCIEIRKRIQDGKLGETEKVVADLDGGVLTGYPLKATPLTETENVVEPEGHDKKPQGIRRKQMAKKHVFLSYCHDSTADVQQLHDELVAAGESVWWDKHILPGKDWKRAIRKAMKESYAVVLCLSPELEARVTAGVYPEIADAITEYRTHAPGNTFLIPVRLAECEIPDIEIDDTRTLKNLQYVDLYPLSQRAASIHRLCQAIQQAPHYPSLDPSQQAAPDVTSPSISVLPETDSGALGIWKDKLAFLQEQEAIASDAAQKFALKKQIEEAEAKIRELGG